MLHNEHINATGELEKLSHKLLKLNIQKKSVAILEFSLCFIAIFPGDPGGF